MYKVYPTWEEGFYVAKESAHSDYLYKLAGDANAGLTDYQRSQLHHIGVELLRAGNIAYCELRSDADKLVAMLNSNALC